MSKGKLARLRGVLLTNNVITYFTFNLPTVTKPDAPFLASKLFTLSFSITTTTSTCKPPLII